MSNVPPAPTVTGSLVTGPAVGLPGLLSTNVTCSSARSWSLVAVAVNVNGSPCCTEVPADGIMATVTPAGDAGTLPAPASAATSAAVSTSVRRATSGDFDPGGGARRYQTLRLGHG